MLCALVEIQLPTLAVSHWAIAQCGPEEPVGEI